MVQVAISKNSQVSCGGKTILGKPFHRTRLANPWLATTTLISSITETSEEGNLRALTVLPESDAYSKYQTNDKNKVCSENIRDRVRRRLDPFGGRLEIEEK